MRTHTQLRTHILTAIAAGLVLETGCGAKEPPPSARVEIPRQPPSVEASNAPTAYVPPAPPATATVTASAPPPASASATPPEDAAKSASTASSAPTPRPTTCASHLKKERYCFDAFKGPATQLRDPKRTYDSRGCLPDSEVRNTCNGVIDILAGPNVEGKNCCYTVCRGMLPPCGRPLLADNAEARLAPIARRLDWTDGVFDVRAVPRAMAERLRDAWLADALAEHASVAAFARFTLELLAVGAPASLIAASQRAGLEEVAHARACFALAAAYSGSEAHGPGPLALGGVALRSRLVEVAAAAAEEACVGETFSAMAVAEARDVCTDPAVKAVLAGIASEEAEHAALGWRFVAWAVATGGAEVREAVEQAFARALAVNPSIDLASGAHGDRGDGALGEDGATAWRAAGRLTDADRARLWNEARAQILRPSVERLFDDSRATCSRRQ